MATTADMLSEAKAAYHSLLTGVAAVEMRDSNGESVRYTSANASRLKAYIAELEGELAGTNAAVRRPLRPVWA